MRHQPADIARGLALVAMITYHAAWFAVSERLISVDLGHIGWVTFQKCIAASFFGLVGLSLHLAATPQLRTRPYLKRLGRLAACAAVVTTTSVVLDPRQVVTFGILHSILACSLLALPLRHLPDKILLPLAATLIALGAFATHPVFNDPWLSWLGMTTHRAPTFDHQPLLPWLGVVLCGLVVGRRLYPSHDVPLARWRSERPAARGLATMGRHSLLIYMAHVPVLIATMAGLAALLRGR
ncbi:MAG: putative membrane protein [Myxococcota bacterium]|jgi:uncharacterized membrane protein